MQLGPSSDNPDMEEIDDGDGGGASFESGGDMETAVEKAVDAGDWEI